LSDNHLGTDDFKDSYTSASFADQNAGTNKTVRLSGIAISGADIGNYTLQITTSTTAANITPAPLTITAVTNTKTYDTGTSAGASPTVAGLLGSDTVTGLVEAYANPKAGTSKTLTVTAYTVNDGNSGKNYSVKLVDDTTGVIN